MQFAQLKRRTFITLLGGAAAWPLVARAKQSSRVPTVGVLGVATASAWNPWVAGFIQRLRELGWIEGRTLAIEYRWADGRSERFPELAAEFVRLKVDVIVTAGGAVMAAKQATPLIPIVFAVASDPVGSGLVASLARPGGNVTGLSVQATDLVGKRVELLREIVPGLRTLAIMANVGYPAALREMAEVQASVHALGLDAATVEIQRAEDIAPAVEAIKARTQAIYVCIDPLTDASRARIVALTLGARLPAMTGFREAAEAGSLIFYGPNVPDLFRRAAEFVDKILRGTKPSELPVEQPTKFDLVINLKTAKALGLEVPPMLLARADEVIE
jgi:putative tryptophan/tyrosine transport system substrate-binding protein